MSEANDIPLIDVSMDIEASSETVWGILTTPERFGAWMDGTVTFEESPGSPFRAEFPNYHTVIAGEVVTLDHDGRHLGLTWGVESGHHAEVFPAGCSLVEFRVVDSGAGCRVELRHSKLPSAAAAAEQEGGWRYQLSRMALHANRSDLSAGLERTLPQWFSAWNEQDEATRNEALAACCAVDVEFRDDWTTVQGTGLLSMHIANCFTYMPGWTLEPTGDVRVCRGEALVGWRSVGPGDMAIEGFNHVQADPDGTFRRVSGFQAT